MVTAMDSMARSMIIDFSSEPSCPAIEAGVFRRKPVALPVHHGSFGGGFPPRICDGRLVPEEDQDLALHRLWSRG